jgi:two-component system, OmpR family, sensor histidine kinase BaeS
MALDINSAAKRMIKSLWVKFLIVLLVISLISLSAALSLRELIIKDFEEYLEGEREDRVYRVMASIEGSYEKYSGWNPDAMRENAIWALLLGYELTIRDLNDNEVISTNKAVELLPPLMKRRITAISGFSSEENKPSNDPFINYPMFLGGKDIGSLEIRSVIPHGGEGKDVIFMMRSNRFLLLLLFVLGGLSVILSLIFSKRMTDPIKKLTAAAEHISHGNVKSRVSISGNDEISNLARTFNMMADNLEIQEALRRKLTSNIAHELRTPLSAMQGEIEGMLDGLIKVDRERLVSLHEETVRLKHIIEGIEELSRAESSVLELRKQQILLKPFLSNIKGRFEKLFIDKGVALKLECEDMMTLYADPDKISQIIINLLSNALRATDAYGTVIIGAGIKDPEGYITVSDTGSGIKNKDLPFVFERFYKTPEGGLGLGLTIAKELAEAHGGRIEVESEYRKGSTFTLYLPSFTTSS